MARNITDLALFADAMAACHPLAGLGKPHRPGQFGKAAAQARKPLRIAFSPDLGIAETSAEVAAICAEAAARLENDGVRVETAHPDLGRAHEAFDVPRALSYALSFGAELDAIREIIKPENVWNIEKGLELGLDDILSSMAAQGQVFHNASTFMQNYDLLLCPAAIVPPYPVEERYPGYADGVPYSEYYRWLAIVYAITTTTLPVITLPCGTTGSGLPVGLQLVGRAHGEIDLFAFASYIEQLFDWRRPPPG